MQLVTNSIPRNCADIVVSLITISYLVIVCKSGNVNASFAGDLSQMSACYVHEKLGHCNAF